MQGPTAAFVQLRLWKPREVCFSVSPRSRAAVSRELICSLAVSIPRIQRYNDKDARAADDDAILTGGHFRGKYGAMAGDECDDVAAIRRICDDCCVHARGHWCGGGVGTGKIKRSR